MTEAMWNATEVAVNVTESPRRLTEAGWEDGTRSWGVGMACTVMVAVVALVGICGNTLVIVVYMTCVKLQATVSNLLVVSLAITDLTTCLLVMTPSAWALLADRWPLAAWTCDLHCAVNYLCIIVSMMTMALISGERFLAVTQPAIHRTRMSRQMLARLEALVCAEGVVFAVVPIVFRWVRYDRWEAVCAIDWFTYSEALIYVLVAFIVCFSVPAVFILITNTTIIWVSCVSSRARVLPHPLAVQENGQARAKAIRQARRTNRSSLHYVIVRSMLVVITAFFVFLTPFSVTKLIKMWTMDEGSVPGPVNLAATLCQYVASAINPFIYFLLRRDYRAAAWRLLRPREPPRLPATHRKLQPSEGPIESCDMAHLNGLPRF
ncbi:beta-4C adrenergic receptor-like [Penaeus chinensis]|uniref:beta-4C adrenergic receptor-like n=1 Tax=Penaeus chinensis TaxID=139456 RepID=UPI001FB74EB2|nr:beta-4C adrenergic receptor-like [Penaeus chinensis]